MLISKKAYNTLKVVLFFYASRKVSFSIKEISLKMNVSVKVIEQILLMLRKAGILESKRGPGGGYKLTDPSEELTIKQIFDRTGQQLEAMPRKNEKDADKIDIVLAGLYENISNDISEKLKKIKVKDLGKKVTDLIKESGYTYVI